CSSVRERLEAEVWTGYPAGEEITRATNNGKEDALSCYHPTFSQMVCTHDSHFRKILNALIDGECPGSLYVAIFVGNHRTGEITRRLRNGREEYVACGNLYFAQYKCM